MTARTGDVIHTVEQLEALPTGAVLARIHDDQSGPSVYVTDRDLGWVMATEQCNSPGLGSHDQAGNRRTPLTVLHVPGEQEPTEADSSPRRSPAVANDIIEQAARVMDDYGNGYDGLNEVGQREALAHALADAGLLTRELPARDEIARAIYDALSGQYGDFRTTTDAADAVLALLEGRRR